MSVFKKIFSGKKEPAVAKTAQDSISELAETEERLIKKQDWLEKKIEQDIAIARANASSNKRLALQALKRKKNNEKALLHIGGVIQTLEYQRTSLESAHTNAEIFSIMGGAAEALKKIHKNLDVEKTHDLMDDLAEQQEVARGIADAISNPANFGEVVDEDELLAELNDLQEEVLNEKVIKVGPTPQRELPTVPAHELKKKKKETEDLDELESWALG